MLLLIKTVLTILKLGLFLLAGILGILNMDDRYNTNKTTTRTWNLDISEIMFPLKFSILINPGYIEDNLRKIGYRHVFDYFEGVITSENQTSLGWAGKTTDGRTIGTVAGD